MNMIEFNIVEAKTGKFIQSFDMTIYDAANMFSRTEKGFLVISQYLHNVMGWDRSNMNIVASSRDKTCVDYTSSGKKTDWISYYIIKQGPA